MNKKLFFIGLLFIERIRLIELEDRFYDFYYSDKRTIFWQNETDTIDNTVKRICEKLL